MSDSAGRHIPVLVVGGGATGLSAAVFLAWYGVPALLVERRPEPLDEPRARALHPRTMELYRAVGLEDAIREVRSPIAGHDVIAHAETLAGPESLRLPHFLDADTGSLSPCRWATIDQNQLEPVLRDRAVSGGVDVRYATEVVAVDDRPDGVVALLRSRRTGHEQLVRADYLVAADGSHSPVRRMLGIGHDGPGTLARKVNVYFDADLREPLRGRRVILMTLRNPAVHGFLSPIDGMKRWRLAISLKPDQDTTISETQSVRLVRAAIGVDTLPIVIDRVSEVPWEISGRVTRRMCTGRVFVAGDAAHTMPPVGTFGVATGVQDAFNLAWKIGLHHRGLAGPGVLASYETERLPVAQHTTRLTAERYCLVNGGSGDARESAVRQRMTMFGYTYLAGALVPDDVTPHPVEDPDHPSGAPGTRAPHVPLAHDRGPISPTELIGRGFVLLTGSTGWERAAAEVAARSGVRIDHYRIGDSLRDTTGAFHRRYGITDSGAVLMRPDGFIAWRTRTTDPDALAGVVDRVLFR
ncbi:FAD-dependent monooxygenase [Actinosynnema sp. NPDC050801]|uniref:FAD-dependent monooxygenase n=1 Tax=unclassified Actinosynnema TaxID=2637065 RepID=UPI0033EDB1AF